MNPGTLYTRDSTDSTQSDARKLIAAGNARHGDICTALHQSAGRGRVAGRVWEDERDQSLLFTMILAKKELPPAPPLSLLLGLAAARGMEKALSLTPKVKWPNDIYLEDRKAAGILVESEKSWFLCGMGINLNQTVFPAEIAEKAVSLAQISGQAVDRDTLMKALRQEIFLLIDEKSTAILAGLDDRLHWRDCEKTLLLGDPGRQEKITGIVRGLGEDGCLLFEADGVIRRIYSAEFI